MALAIRSAEFDIARAALVMAKLVAYPSLNTASYLAALEELGRSFAEQQPASRPLPEQALLLADFLGLDHCFRGDDRHYGDPRNSLLNDVIDRRLGLPITLAAIYLSIARRAGLDAYGIGLPGHFIVGLRQGDQHLWLDPFSGGRVLDLNDCAELIAHSAGYEGPLESEWFEPISPRAMLARMIQNLKIAYMNLGDWESAIAAIRQWHVVEPESPEYLHELGFCHYQLGKLPQAAYYGNAYLESNPQTPQANMVRAGLTALAASWGDMN